MRCRHIIKINLAKVLFFLTAAFLVTGGKSFAQDTKTPTAQEIFKMYIDACGGKAAFDKIKNRITISTVTDEDTKSKTEIKQYQAKPKKLYSEYRSAELGKVITGTDGNIVWEIPTFGKPRIKEEQEKAIQLRECILDKYIYWEKIFKSIEAQGTAFLGTDNFYKVIGTLHSGETQTLYFDIKTHYLRKVEMFFYSADNKLPVELFINQYKKTGNVFSALQNAVSL